MKIYHQTIKFPQPTMAIIIGGHPAAGPVITEGVVIDTLDDSQEPYYSCYITGNPSAVYPYTSSRYRIFAQSELAPHPDNKIVRVNNQDVAVIS